MQNGIHSVENPVQIVVLENDRHKQEVFRLRYDIFVQEMGKPVMHHRTPNSVSDEMDQWGILLAATKQRQLIGTIRLNLGTADQFPPHIADIFCLDQFLHYSNPQAFCLCTKLAVQQDFRSSQVLYRLLAKTFTICLDQQIHFVFGGCSPSLLPLYESIGFRRFTENFTDPGYGLLVPLVFLCDDTEYLRQIKSPMARITRSAPGNTKPATWLNTNFPMARTYMNTRTISASELLQHLTNKLGFSPQHCPVFAGMTPEDITRCLQRGAFFLCARNEIVIHQGDASNEIFVLVNGCLKMLQEHRETLIYPGTVFGEIGLLGHRQQSATYVAAVNSEIFVLSRQAYERFQQKSPTLSRHLRQFCYRYLYHHVEGGTDHA